MSERIVSVIFDFDETLGTDTISFFLQKNNVNPVKFWQEIQLMVKDGWDPPLAYMHKLLELSKSNKLDLSKKNLIRIGKELPLFPGLPDAFKELKEYILTNKELCKAKVAVEFYIISGGLEEMIRATRIAPYLEGIFGSNFAYNKKEDQPYGIKSAISFTEKTRYVHGIKKGIGLSILRSNPYRINDVIATNLQRVPFSQMIYIGDGPSDVPCLSAITRNGGIGIGVSAPFGTFKKGYELARGKRITLGPYTANYKKGSDMRKILEEAILRIGLEIDVNHKKNI